MFKSFLITDRLVIFYVFFCMFWIVIGRNSITNANILFINYCYVLLYILLILILQHFVKNPIVRFIRLWYPLTIIGFFFNSATQMDMVIFKDYLDPILQHIDQVLFGYQPAVVWGNAFNGFFIQEFFHFSYFSYYILIFTIPLYVYLSFGNEEFTRVMFNLLFVFISCYTVYLFLPVVGGRYIPGVQTMTETYRHGMFTHIMVYMYRNVSHWGGAFPSSHVAVTFTIWLLSFRYFKKLPWFLLLNLMFLSISTVFCHYHYFIDVIAGLGYGLVMFGLSELIYAIWGRSKRQLIVDM